MPRNVLEERSIYYREFGHPMGTRCEPPRAEGKDAAAPRRLAPLGRSSAWVGLIVVVVDGLLGWRANEVTPTLQDAIATSQWPASPSL